MRHFGNVGLQILRLAILLVVAAVLPAQEPLMPKRIGNGIEFAVKAPAAGKAWLLADFNKWGEPRTAGQPAAAAAMERGDDGVFRRTQTLAPGTYHFRYALDAKLADSVSLDATRLPIAPDGSHILRIDPKGEVVAEGTPYVYAPTPAQGGTEFRVYAPRASAVFLVGTFNNWGDAQDGVVTDLGYRCFRVANKEFVKVIDVPPGHHEYAAVLDLGQGASKWIEGPEELPLGESKHRGFTITEGNRAAAAAPTAVPTPLPPALSATGERVPPNGPFCFPPRLLPDGGVDFAVYAPQSNMVNVFGDFNGWATHEDESVLFPATRLYSVGNGYFRRTVYLFPDTYSFKYCVDGRMPWIAPSSIYLNADADGNAVFTIADGNIALNGKYNPWKVYNVPPAPAEGKPARDARVLRIFYHPTTPGCGPVLKWVFSPTGRDLNAKVPMYLTDITKKGPALRTYQILRVPTAVLVEADGTERERVVFDGNVDAFLQRLDALAKKGIRR